MHRAHQSPTHAIDELHGHFIVAAHVEGIDRFLEQRLIGIGNLEKRHARAELDVIGFVQDVQCCLVTVGEHQSGAFFEPGPKLWMLQVLPCTVVLSLLIQQRFSQLGHLNAYTDALRLQSIQGATSLQLCMT